jgi:RNA polymerase sigma factor (sigma-70 family)
MKPLRDGNDVDAIIQREVFKAPSMPQEEVVSCIRSIEALDREALLVLMFNTRWVTYALVPYVVDIASGNVRRKRILHKSKEEQVDTPSDAISEIESDEDSAPETTQSESSFLAACFVLFYDLIESQPKDILAGAFLRSGIVRSVQESMIDGFLKASREYVRTYREFSKTLVTVVHLGESADRVNELSAELAVYEGVVGGNQLTLYGTIRHIAYLNGKADSLRRRIVQAYRRIAYKLARRHSPADGSFVLDNFQNGCVGLVKAVAYYDPNEPSRFARYAVWWVRQYMLLALKDSSNFVRLAQTAWSNFQRYDDIAVKLAVLRGESEVTDETVVVADLVEREQLITHESVKKGVDQLRSLRENIRTAHVWSIERPANDEEGYTPTTTLVDPATVDQHDNESVELSFAYLTEKERRWMFMQHGMSAKLGARVRNIDLLDERLRQKWIASQ